MEFITRLFDTSDFPARWRCGHWTPAHGWLHILSDVGVWAAYFAIPLVLAYFVARRRDLPYRRVFLLFVAFILLCGTTHLMEAAIFWWPAYRLAGVLKLVTAVVSWVTVLALVRVAPAVLAMRAPEELEREVAARTDAERRLKEANAELERRVEERTADLGRSVAALQWERELLRTTLLSIGDAVVTTDSAGRVTRLNGVAETLTGWTDVESQGQPLETVFRIVNETTRLRVANPAIRAIEEGVVVGLANHTVLIARGGAERPIEDSAAPIRSASGEVVGSVLVFRDISERLRTEARVKAERDRVQLVADAVPALISYVDADAHYRLNNHAYETWFGHPRGELVGRHMRDVLGESAWAAIRPHFEAALAGRVVSYEAEVPYRDGGTRWIMATYTPDVSGDGTVHGVVAHVTDISALKRAERQVATTLESITDGFLRYDRDWRIVYANAEAERINRLTRSEMLGKTPWELFPAVVGTKLEAEFRRAVAEQVTVEFENHYEPFGRWYSLKGYPTPDGGLTAFIRDITEQKVQQEALAASEARLRRVFESNVVGMIRWDLDRSLILDANAEFLRMTGYTRDDVAAGRLNFRDMTPAEWTPRNEEGIRTIRAEGHAAPYEKEYFRKDGSRVPLIIAGTRFDDSTSEGMSLIVDISDRKRAEQEIVRLAAESDRQRRLYETILTNTPDFVYVFSLDHKVLYANDALIKMWGRGHDGAIGKTFLEIGYEPWHAELHDREIDQVRATRQPIRGEVPFTGTHGRRQYEYIFVPVIGADGEVEAVAGTTRDVTERHEAEAALRESEERSAFVRRSSGVGFWYCDLPFDVLQWDELVKAHFHLPLDAAVTIQTFYDRLHPDDREPTRQAIERSIAGRTPYHVDYRTVDPDTGAVTWVRAIGRTFYAGDGTPTRFDGVTLDVSDQKRAEERQAFLIRLADTLRPLSDPVDVQAEASRMLGEHLGANRVVYFEIRGNEYVIERDYTAGVRPLAGRYPVAAFGPALLAILLDGRTVIEADATTEPDRPPGERAAFAAIQVRGHVGVPLVKSGRFVAGMAVHLSDRRDWTRPEVALIEDTAERTWAAVERVRAEREVARLAITAERERRLFAAVLSNTPDFIYTFDLEGRFVYVNTALLALWGKRLDEAVGRNFFDLDYPPALADRLQRQIQQVIETKQPVRDETPYTSGQGERMYEYILAPVVGAGDIVEAVAGSTRDITDRKVAEVERERLVGQLRDQDRRKDEFLATLAHELRNPLAPIRNGLQVMRLSGTNGTIEQARTMMERQLTQLVRLVDDLLDMSRVTSGKLELRRERLELRAVIDAAVETSRPAIEQAGHHLAVSVPDEPIFLDGDSTRLAQVVANLLNNSAKYTHRGGHVRLAVRRENGLAALAVADDGIGIPPNMLGKVFEMFAQVDRTLEKTTGGLGIGLSLVKGLVEMHGGTIEARSDGEGRGSEFIVRLPAVPSAVPNVEPPVIDKPAGPSRRRRILVADDNVDSAKSLGLLLELLGNDVSTANDGLQAVDVAERLRPDVILLDIGMPKLSGYEACRRIREQPWGKNALLVAMTGWGQDEDRRRSQEAGFDHHLVKPVDPGALQKLLSSSKAESA